MKCLGGEGLCDRPVWEDGLCRGHYARKRRGQSVSEPLRWWGDPKRSLFEAALALADIGDDDAAYLRIIRRFWMAHRRLAQSSRNKVHGRAQSPSYVRRKA